MTIEGKMTTRWQQSTWVVAGCAILLVVAMGLVSCSRQEQGTAKKPAAKGATRTETKAVTNAAPISSNATAKLPVAPPGAKVAKPRTADPKHLPPLSAETRERQRAVRERQEEFARKTIEQELSRKQAELAQCEKDLLRAEHTVRTESDVAAALAAVHQAASNLENECVNRADGFRALLNEQVALEAKVAAYVPDVAGTNGVEAEVLSAAARLRELSRTIEDRRRMAAIEIPEVAGAYRVLVEQGKAYQQALAGKSAYRAAQGKADSVREEIADLTRNQEN